MSLYAENIETLERERVSCTKPKQHRWSVARYKTLAFRFLSSDRIRTMINVEGDSIGVGIVAHLSRNDLAKEADSNHDEDLVFGNRHALGKEEVAGGSGTKGDFVVPSVYEQTNM